MNKATAGEHGRAYASGREDGSGIKTVPAAGHDSVGWIDFGDAYAQGWDDLNHERRGNMTSAGQAYDRWQATGGESIFAEDDTTAAYQARLAGLRVKFTGASA